MAQKPVLEPEFAPIFDLLATMPPISGTPIAEVRAIWDAGASPDGEAVAEVRDHGMGIAQKDVQRIFGQFERAVHPRNYGGLGLGLFISTIAHTQQVAFQAAMLASFLPTFMLSGFIFPISSMPRFLQIVTYAIPARYFLIALRGIVLKGTGIEAFGIDLVALAVFAVIVLALASVRLRRQWV